MGTVACGACDYIRHSLDTFQTGHNETSKFEDSESEMEQCFVCLLLRMVTGDDWVCGLYDIEVQSVE